MGKKEKVGIKEVSAAISEQFQELNNGKAKEVVHAVFTTIMGLADTNPKGVHLQGVGAFRWVERAERIGRNPKTGEAVTIPAKRKFVFKKSKTAIV